MSKDETDIAAFLENAENMIAEGLDAVTFARKCVAALRKQLFDCEAKLAECKAEKINRAEELAECEANRAEAELIDLIEAIKHNTVGVFAGKHGYDVPSPFPAPEDLWLFYARMFKAVLESHPGEFDGKECQEEVLSGVRAELAECKKELAEKSKADGPTPELLREFMEAVASGRVSGFAIKKGWVRYMDFEGRLNEYYGHIAKLVLESYLKGFDAWQARYYPVPADKVPKEQRARAALQKWRGMTPEVLAEYGLARDGVRLSNGKRRHDADSGTCSLCQGTSCGACLLYGALGGHNCAEIPNGPHHIWCETGDAGPMIAALEKAVELEIEKYGEESPAVAS